MKVLVATATPAGSGYRARVKAVTADETTFIWTQKVRVGDVEV